MRRTLRFGVAALIAGVLCGTGASTFAQTPSGQTSDTESVRVFYPRPILRISQDFTLPADAEASHVLVILGSATIEGRVTGDLFVWLGDVRLGPTAVVEDELVVIAGNLTVDPGAIVDDSLLVVGGELRAPSGFAPRGEQFLIGTPALGEGVRAIVPWVTRGLLWGRPLVPDLPWVWPLIGITLLLAVVLNQLFEAPVRAAAEATIERPWGSLLTGMLVMLVAGPLVLIVGATIIGLVLLPIVLCVAVVAWILGQVGVARGLGSRLVRQGDPDSRFQSLRSLVIGFAAITLAYMVPVLGLVSWSIVSVISLGTATTMLLGSVRREYPRAPQEPPDEPVVPPPPAPVPPSSGGPAVLDPEPAPAGPMPPPPIPPPQAGSLLAFARAGALDRVVAFAIDCVIVAIAVQLFEIWEDGMFFFLLLAYHIVFWAWQGTTLGGIVAGVRLIRTDGSELRIIDALVRGLSSLLSFAALGIGLFWMLQDPERQTWHDKIAGTYAVKVPRNYPLR